MVRLKYEVIKEGWFGAERVPTETGVRCCWGGGSGGGRMRRGVKGCIGVEATTKSLRCGKGSGTRIASRWQLGILVECMSLSRGWVMRALE